MLRAFPPTQPKGGQRRLFKTQGGLEICASSGRAAGRAVPREPGGGNSGCAARPAAHLVHLPALDFSVLTQKVRDWAR